MSRKIGTNITEDNQLVSDTSYKIVKEISHMLEDEGIEDQPSEILFFINIKIIACIITMMSDDHKGCLNQLVTPYLNSMFDEMENQEEVTLQ